MAPVSGMLSSHKGAVITARDAIIRKHPLMRQMVEIDTIINQISNPLLDGIISGDEPFEQAAALQSLLKG